MKSIWKESPVSNVPVFAAMQDSGKNFAAPSTIYAVKKFSHGLDFADIGTVSEIETPFRRRPLAAMPEPIASECGIAASLRHMGQCA